jgi:integrase
MGSHDRLYRALPLDEWPAGDQAAWADARCQDDLLDPEGLAASWTRKSVRARLLAYGLWLDHLARLGRLDLLATPGARVEEMTLASFIAELEQRVTPLTLAGYIARLTSMIAALDSTADLTLLARARRRLRARLPPADLPVPPWDSATLLRRALTRWRQLAWMAAPSEHLRAAWRRDALILALLAARPLRLANLTGLRLGRDLIREEAGYQVRVDGSETKNRRPIHFVLPAVLTNPLDHYLHHERPFLLGPNASDRLWISVRRKPMSEQAIYSQVVATTAELLGRPLHPHAFRHAAATSTAEVDPELLGIASRLLGHGSLDVTRAHYDRSRMRTAQRRHTDHVRSLRAELRREGADRG